MIRAQCSIPVEVIFGAGQLGGRTDNRSRSLFDHRFVHAPVGESGPLRRDARLCAGELRTVISILQL